jgi:chromosome segregation ATPase
VNSNSFLIPTVYIEKPGRANKKKAEAQLKEWKAKIEELRAKSEKIGADARVEYAEQIEFLKKRREELRDRLSDMREGSDDAWKAFKTGMEKGMHEFTAGLNQAMAIFRDKGKREGDKNAEDASAEPEVCVRAEAPEHARFHDEDMGCDDGREGKID